MRIHVIDHPLAQHSLTQIRRQETTVERFRHHVDVLSQLLGVEATRSLPTKRVSITTPLTDCEATELQTPLPLIVPILRAGLGMVDEVMRLMPAAEVGFLGMVRDHKTLIASTYVDRMPQQLTGRDVYVLDPMLATGGSMVDAIELLRGRGTRSITAISIVSAPEGIAAMERAFGDADDVSLFTAAIDQGLNEVGYIVPGLGDAGDRLFGPPE